MVLKTLKPDEQFSRSTTVNGNVVKVTRSVKPSKDASVRHPVEWSFDFSEVSQDELLELATSELVIRVQRDWRNMTDAEREKHQVRDYYVREILDTTRQRQADPVKKVTSLLDKMSEAEKAALYEQYFGGK